MSAVTIIYKLEEKPVKEKIERELNWYDIIKKEMQIFHGGKLSFKYRKDDYLIKMGEKERKRRGIKTIFRILPEVEDVEVINYNKTNKIDNKNKVEKWFNEYINYNNTEAIVVSRDGNELIINIPEKEKDDFIYQIEREGFEYIIK